MADPRIPKLSGSATATPSLRLSATEGFILSRIDGRATEGELASLTGLSQDTIRSTLDKLESAKVIHFLSRPPPPPPPVPTDRPGASSSTPPQPAPRGASPAPEPPAKPDAGGEEKGGVVAPRVRAAMAAIPRDAPELAEDVDMPEPLRVRVLASFNVLESLDYYELLSVERAADKKGVKRSYFELAALFHPDRYFRKKLGSYKPKMEAIFARVTQAYDTLSNKELRSEYDAYLLDLDKTRSAEEMFRQAAEEAERAELDAQRSAGRASFPDGAFEPQGVPGASPVPRTSGFYSSLSERPPGSAVPPARTSTPRPPSAPSAPTVSDQARRDALAMRLLGSRSLPPRNNTTAPPGSGAPRSSDGGDALKRRYEERINLARKAQADKYIAMAREADAKRDVLGASTAYRVALGFLGPGDPNLAVAKEGIARADHALSETYLRQAQYEDRSEHWADAARSWQRVIRGRPQDARAHERAAHAMAKSQGDLHVAAELAQKAIALEPQNADYKITLAAVFIEAGLLLNARRELEAAAQLSPRNATIQTLLKRVKAG